MLRQGGGHVNFLLRAQDFFAVDLHGLHLRDLVAGEAHEFDFLRRLSVNPLLVLGAGFALADLLVRTAAGGVDQLAVHADQDVVIGDSVFELGGQTFDEDLRRAPGSEIEDGREQSLGLFHGEIGDELVELKGQDRANRHLAVVGRDRDGVGAYADLEVLIPLFLFLGPAVQFKDDAAVTDEDVGDLPAVAGASGQSIVGDKVANANVVGREASVAELESFFAHRKKHFQEHKLGLEPADEVHAGGGGDRPVGDGRGRLVLRVGGAQQRGEGQDNHEYASHDSMWAGAK